VFRLLLAMPPAGANAAAAGEGGREG
jgi:hypothetical protein